MINDLELVDGTEDEYDLAGLGMPGCFFTVAADDLSIMTSNDIFMFGHLSSMENVEAYFKKDAESEGRIIRNHAGPDGQEASFLKIPEEVFLAIKEIVQHRITGQN